MTRKELLQLGRDRALLVFFAYAFTLDIYLAGSGLSMQLQRAAMVYFDGDQSAASRDLVDRFRAPYFDVRGAIPRASLEIPWLDRNRVMLVLDIPPRFQESLVRGQQARVQFLIDATHAPLGYLAASYGAQIVGQFGLEQALRYQGLTQEVLERSPMVENRYRVRYNPNQEDAWFTSLSELLAIVTIFSILLPAAALVRERERGTVEQLLVSPLTPLQIMLPKVFAMTLVILVGTLVSIHGIIGPLLGVPFRGSAWLYFGLTGLYVFTNAGLGFAAATVARNQAQVGMMSILLVAPMILLSGAWTPPEAMPGWLRHLMVLSPLYHYIEASFGIVLKGVGIELLWRSILSMAGIGGVLFAFGVWRFRKQLE
jgi:ABC-2 type transport system permease protein